MPAANASYHDLRKGNSQGIPTLTPPRTLGRCEIDPAPAPDPFGLLLVLKLAQNAYNAKFCGID